MKALKVSTSGVREVVDFTTETSYQTIRDAVGGYIECVYLPSLNVEMWVNEEGKLVDAPIQNPMGTALWTDNYGETDVTVGDIIFTGGTDSEGNTLGLSDEQLNALLGYDKTITIEDLDISDYIGFTIEVRD